MSRPPISRAAAAGLLALAGAFVATSAPAQSGAFPGRPFRVITQTSAGSTTDVVARTLGDRMSNALGQPWLVDNRTGAGGLIATEAVARAAPDGHTRCCWQAARRSRCRRCSRR